MRMLTQSADHKLWAGPAELVRKSPGAVVFIGLRAAGAADAADSGLRGGEVQQTRICKHRQ